MTINLPCLEGKSDMKNCYCAKFGYAFALNFEAHILACIGGGIMYTHTAVLGLLPQE